MKDYKFSMFSWFGYYDSAPDRLRLLKQTGFDGVMLALEDESEPVYLSFEKQADFARGIGLQITNAHAPFAGWNDLWSPSDLQAEPLMNQFRNWILRCSKNQIETLVVHTTDMDLLPGYSPKKAVKRYARLADFAAENQVKLAVENVSRPFLLRYLFDQIDHPNLGFCYDSSHDFMLPCARGKILHDYKDRLIALHLSDNDLKMDRHQIPTEGKIDYRQIMSEIAQSPIDTLSLEVIRPQDDMRTPQAYAADAYKALDYLRGLIPENA